jgi:lathosterol oxidase
MDLVLDAFDSAVGDAFYAALPTSTSSLCTSANELVKAVCPLLPSSGLARTDVLRQALSLCLITYIGIYVLYFSVATLSYYLIFDHRMKSHPRFLPNQIKQEIRLSMDSFAPVSVLTLPWFVADVRGWSKLYGSMAEGPAGEGAMGYLYMAASAGAFLLFTDYLIFWVHKTLHHPALYKKLHKPHHRFISTSSSLSHLIVDRGADVVR